MGFAESMIAQNSKTQPPKNNT